MGIEKKSSIEFCKTPELALSKARSITEGGVLGVFWTCAVYNRENELFFQNPDVLPFFSQQTMALDVMQLAASDAGLRVMEDPSRTRALRIASHPSPQALLYEIAESIEILTANSNSEAAERCMAGEADLCITTETSRADHRLHSLRVVGSPDMVFFAGITERGARLLERAWQDSLLVRGQEVCEVGTTGRCLE